MEFEYDPIKSKANQQKHGLNFEQAQLLWDDPDLIEIAARTEGEPRFLQIGQIGQIGRKHWTAVVTYRSKTIRLISIRRSRREEIAIYENDNNRTI